MDQRLESAVNFVRTAWEKRPFDEGRYLNECEYIIEHRADLPFRVFVQLPGGLTSNRQLKWDTVKAGSDERCGCGNERVILPGNPRMEYEPSEAGSVVVSVVHKVYLKPVGGDKASTYVQFSIEGQGLAFLLEPLAPLVLTPDIFSVQGFPFDQLAKALKKERTKPLALFFGKEKTPVCAITAVDLEAQTVTITPDRAVEAFDPDSTPDGHVCDK